MLKKTNQISPISKLKKVLDADSVRKQFENALQENAGGVRGEYH